MNGEASPPAMRVLLAAAVLLLAVPAAAAATATEAEVPQEAPVRVESCDRGGTSVYVGTITVFECALDGVFYHGPCPYGSGTVWYVVGQPIRLCFFVCCDPADAGAAQEAPSPYVGVCDDGGVEAQVGNVHLHCTQVGRIVQVYPCSGPSGRGVEAFVLGRSLGCIY